MVEARITPDEPPAEPQIPDPEAIREAAEQEVNERIDLLRFATQKEIQALDKR